MKTFVHYPTLLLFLFSLQNPLLQSLILHFQIGVCLSPTRTKKGSSLLFSDEILFLIPYSFFSMVFFSSNFEIWSLHVGNEYWARLISHPFVLQIFLGYFSFWCFNSDAEFVACKWVFFWKIWFWILGVFLRRLLFLNWSSWDEFVCFSILLSLVF